MTVTVKRIGGSVAVLIPKAVAREMELNEGTELNLTTSGDEIVMRKQTRRHRRPRRSLAAIVSQINPASYRRHTRELRDNGPVGKEIW